MAEVVDFQGAKRAAADRRVQRLTELLASIDADEAIQCDSTADYDKPVVLQGDLELKLRQLHQMLGYERLPLVKAELDGILAYGRAVAADAAGGCASTVESRLEQSVRDTALAITSGRTPSPQPYEKLHLSANYQGTALNIKGPLLDFLGELDEQGSAAFNETVRLRNQILPFEGERPVVVGEYPILTHPALETVRKMKIPYSNGLLVGEALRHPYIGTGVASTGLLKVGLWLTTRPNYVEVRLMLHDETLHKAFKKAKRPNWAAELAPLAHDVRPGAAPQRMFRGSTPDRWDGANLMFAVPTLRQAKAEYEAAVRARYGVTDESAE